jgi:3-oxoacyl-[acyl-carrier protein] reductase
MLTVNFDGKTALVTGAGQGIGRDIALLLAEHGAAVAAVDVNLAGAEETASLIRTAGGESLAARCDVGDWADVERCAIEVLGWRGQLHFLVNNAGITRDNLLLRMSDAEWESVLKVNLTGTFNMTKAVARSMIKKRFGRIVNISSVIGIMGNAGQCNYAASKAGIIGFTKAVAKELAGRNVTVNAVAPGFIETAMTAALPEERKEEMRRLIPLGRFGSGRDVANVVLFLLSDLAGYVTGQVLRCDGGMVMA